MATKDDRLKLAAERRLQVEAIAQGNSRRIPAAEHLGALAPQETQRMLHELQLHQIELEMQNEELRRMQQELDASRARYFDLYDLAPVGYCTISEEGLIQEANLTAAGLLDMARDALVNQPLSRFILKEDQDTYYLHRKQLLNTGAPQACELRLVKRDGTQFWARLEAVSAQDTLRTPASRVVLSDITERKIQENMRELTVRLIALVNTPGDFHGIMSDLTACLQARSGCEAVGIRLRAGEDYPYYETLGFPSDFVLAEDPLCAHGPNGKGLRDSLGDPVLQCMCANVLCGRFDPSKSCFSAQGSFWSNNATALLASGSWAKGQARTCNLCNGEGYESVALIPLRAGQQVFGLLQFNDHRPNRFTVEVLAHLEEFASNLCAILVQRQSKEALRESEQRLALALKGTTDGIWDYDVRSNSVYRSSHIASLLDCGSAGLQSTVEAWFKHVHPEDLPDVLKAWQAHLDGANEQYVAEYRMRAASGEYLWVLDSGKIVDCDAHGQPLRVAGTHINITERKRAEDVQSKLEAQLQQAQKMESVGRLAGGVAHDFNNMLSVILGYTELSLKKADPSQRLYSYLEEIHKAAERSADITQQLLAFARKQTVAPRVLNLNDTIADMLNMLERMINENIQLIWRPDDDLWPVKVDPSQIDQILANLCVNSRDAIGDIGKITIETTNCTFDESFCSEHLGFLPGEYVQLTVSDDGCGMSQEIMDQLFEPFFTTKEVGKGTGLGLSMVYGAVKQNNGFINVESKPSEGTTFTIHFPRHIGLAGLARQQEKSGLAKRGLETILLVEDEHAILKLATTMLEEQGYTVLAAIVPGEAIRLAREHPGDIDMLMADVIMPDMSGRDLAKYLLSLHPRLKCLFTSGYAADVIADQGVLDEGVQFIQKPFSIHDLTAKVREALDSE